MVSASRCNLLSRSLPNYQKEVLDYTNSVANEFHSLLVDLRTHHHHQYKVRDWYRIGGEGVEGGGERGGGGLEGSGK